MNIKPIDIAYSMFQSSRSLPWRCCGLVLLAVVLCATAAPLAAHTPQWRSYGKVIPGSFNGIAADHAGRIFAVQGGTLNAYDADGNLLHSLGTVQDFRGMVFDSANRGYVLDGSANPAVKVFDQNGNLLRSIIEVGVENEKIGSVSVGGDARKAIAISSDNKILIADQSKGRIAVFDNQGNFLKSWGQIGTFEHHFPAYPMAVFVLPDDRVMIAFYYYASHAWISHFKIYTVSGDYLAILADGMGWIGSHRFSDRSPMAMDRSGIFAHAEPHSYMVADIPTYNVLVDIRFSPFNRLTMNHLAFDAAGNLLYVNNSGIHFLQRHAGDVDLPLAPKAFPQVALHHVGQVAGTTDLKVEFTVHDLDSAQVDVAVVGYRHGTRTFGNLLIPSSATMNGAPGAAGQVARDTRQTVIWNLAEDWEVTLGNIQVDVIALDDRQWLPFRWVTLPGNEEVAAFAISDRPLNDALFYPVWLWLVASGDSGVTLSGGRVVGTTGAYAGVAFTDTGTGTTQAGRNYLMDRLNIRPITVQELEYANSGRFFLHSTGNQSVVRK